MHPPEPPGVRRAGPAGGHSPPRVLGREAGRIGEEVLQHLAGLLHAEVEVTLEIRAKVPDGVPEHVLRTVTENCRTLRFTAQEFEEA